MSRPHVKSTRTFSYRSVYLAVVVLVMAAMLAAMATPTAAQPVAPYWEQLGDDIGYAGNAAAMSRDGDTVIIGDSSNSGGTYYMAGQARVYRWHNNSWAQLGGNINGEGEWDESGYSVAMSSDGNTVIIGAPYNDHERGHARVYRWNNASWVQVGGDIDGEDWDYSFGFSVAMSGDGNTVIIGAPSSGGPTGHARVYEWNNTSWVQVGGDIEGGGAVAMSSDGTTVVTGDRVYQWNNTSWVQVGGAIDGGGVVAMSGDGNTVVGGDRVYRWNGTSWVQVGGAIDGGGVVAMSGDGKTVIIGEGVYRLVEDTDGDGVMDHDDVCADTVIPDPTIPTRKLGTNRWALVDGDGDFDTVHPAGKAPTRSYTISDTGGCNAEQIADALHLGNVHYKHGLSTAAINRWAAMVVTTAPGPPSAAFWEQLGADISSGYSVAMSSDGNTFIVGDPYASGNGDRAGQARVYRWDNTSWVQVGSDIDGEAAGDESSRSVAMSSDGNTVIVGAPSNSSNGDRAGQARVYRWDNTSWVQVGADIDGEAAGDGSGWSVAMSGDGNTVIVGAPFNDGGDNRAGQARVYRWNNTSWVQVGADIDGGSAGDESGSSVAMSSEGNTIIVGAPFQYWDWDILGYAQVLRWNGTSWIQDFDFSGEGRHDEFGTSVAMSTDGNTVIIGAPENGSTGQARVYRWNGTSWLQVGGDIDGEALHDESGFSVAMSGDGNTVIIGAPINNRARVYRWNGSGFWVQVGGDIVGETEWVWSGWSVAMNGDGNTVIIGAPHNSGTDFWAGYARVYRLVGDSDGDGVVDRDDLCADTVIPDPTIPTRRLGTNRWALVDDDGDFDTFHPRGKAPTRTYAMVDTGGCNAEQIADALRLGKGHYKYGLSTDAMNRWVRLVGN